MYSLASLLAELITRRGGQIRCGADVELTEIDETAGRARAAYVAESAWPSTMVANRDAAQFLPPASLQAAAPAISTRGHHRAGAPLSALFNPLSWRAGVAELPLVHHNVFFSRRL